MPSIKSYPNNQDVYIGAEEVMRWHHGRTSGVYGAAGQAAVAAVQSSMAVTVSDGEGWITNDEGNGVHWWIDTHDATGSKLQLSVDPAHSTLGRIDRVVVEWKTTNYVDLPDVKILKGTASSSPSAPALTNNSTLRQISLARISIPAGTLSLTSNNITDERLDPAVCGIVTESVKADTSMINAQAQALLQGIADELKALQGGSGVELKKLVFYDTAVLASEWAADSTYPDYPVRASVALTSVVATMIPDITLALADATSGNIAPVAECYNGGVWLYAASKPDAQMVIPTIICWKGA